MIDEGACSPVFAQRLGARLCGRRWLLLYRTGIDSDGLQSRRRQFEGEQLSGLVVPAPDGSSGLALDLPHEASSDQLLRDLLSHAALEVRRRRQAVIVALRRCAKQDQLGVG
ncbi:MAG TPA: hypothetical protein VE820_04850 [Sphingomicrobium sp.]|nr:hypothetical protein [Sphingomicrobium sp.]